MRNIIIIGMVPILFFAILLVWAKGVDTSEIPARLPELATPLESSPKGPALDWLKEHRAAIKIVVVEELEQAARDMNDPAKMRSAIVDAKTGVPVGSIGILLGLAITTLVKAVISAIIYAVLWAVVIYLLKSYWMYILLAAIFPVVFVVVISWLTSRNVALAIWRKMKCAT